MLRTLMNTATFGVLALVLATGAGKSLVSSAPGQAEAAAGVIGEALGDVRLMIAERAEAQGAPEGLQG